MLSCHMKRVFLAFLSFPWHLQEFLLAKSVLYMAGPSEKLGSCYSMWRSKHVWLKLAPDGGQLTQKPDIPAQSQISGHPTTLTSGKITQSTLNCFKLVHRSPIKSENIQISYVLKSNVWKVLSSVKVSVCLP